MCTHTPKYFFQWDEPIRIDPRVTEAGRKRFARYIAMELVDLCEDFAEDVPLYKILGTESGETHLDTLHNWVLTELDEEPSPERLSGDLIMKCEIWFSVYE